MGSLKRIITVSAGKHKPYFFKNPKSRLASPRSSGAAQAVYSSQLFPVA